MMQIDYSQFLNERRAQKSQQEIAGKGTGARLPSCRIIAFVVPTARPGKECLCLRVWISQLLTPHLISTTGGTLKRTAALAGGVKKKKFDNCKKLPDNYVIC